MPLPRIRAQSLELTASLVCFLALHQRRLGCGAPLDDVLNIFGLSMAQLRSRLNQLSKLGTLKGSFFHDHDDDSQVEAYLEGGRLHLYGFVTKLKARGLDSIEKASLKAAAGLMAGSVPAPQAKILRHFARHGPRIRALAASKNAQLGLRALAEDRILIQNSDNEKYLPLSVVWYQGQPCLEVAVLGPSQKRRKTRRLRLDRFPVCKLQRSGASHPKSKKFLKAPNRKAGGVRGVVVLSGASLVELMRDSRRSHGMEKKLILEADNREDLIRRILRFGTDAKVHGPAWLRTALRARAEETVGLYKASRRPH